MVVGFFSVLDYGIFDIDWHLGKHNDRMDDKTMTQKDLILEHLKKGNSLTTASAVDLFKIYRLSERIRELEKLGHAINRENETTSGGARIVRYRWAGYVDMSDVKTDTKNGTLSGIKIIMPVRGDLFPDRTNRHSEFI